VPTKVVIGLVYYQIGTVLRVHFPESRGGTMTVRVRHVYFQHVPEDDSIVVSYYAENVDYKRGSGGNASTLGVSFDHRQDEVRMEDVGHELG
jgi:hypothetical protein